MPAQELPLSPAFLPKNYDRDQRIVRTAQQRATARQQKSLRRRRASIPRFACRCAKSKSATPNPTPARSRRMRPCASMIAAGRGAIPHFTGTSEEGLPALRRDWILKRGDVEEYDGREVKPQDNGYLSGKHAEFASAAEKNRLVEFPGLTSQRRRPLRAKAGKVVTQLQYARAGIITPEMEFIAIRENMGRAKNRGHGERHRPQRPRQAARRFPAAREQRIHAVRFPEVSAAHPERDHAGIRPRRSRRRPRHHSRRTSIIRKSSR